MVPLGVTGNMSDSGSEESWFEPRRGNRRGSGCRNGGRTFVFSAGPLSPAERWRQYSVMTPPTKLPSMTIPERDTVLAVLRANRGRLVATYGIKDLQLFGSVVRGEATEASDIDLVVEFDPDRISLSSFLDFSDDLEALLGRRVDVVSLKKLAPRLRAQVEAEAIRVA